MVNHSVLVIACQWIMRLAWLNFLWILLTIRGGLLFGLVPATVTVGKVIINFREKAKNLRFVEIVKLYQGTFLISNKLALILGVPFISICWYMHWFYSNTSDVFGVAVMSLIPVLMLYFLFIIFCITQLSYSNNDNVIKFIYSCAEVFLSNGSLIFILFISIMLEIMVMLFFPVVFIIFGVSSFIFFINLRSWCFIFEVTDSCNGECGIK
ncbi:DUF624 domain-containing protein [Vibrio sp. SM6]|uniref:DUF624 domain-containing protein n=1 Tax=Vibrio agarilyticus TaxID=2726741 RepID=A0A7X8TUI5_9VIBR|nr:DUF624 domain-containing protein [Vibrio agarilyticus]NLS14881.1 DUF624 domain-containing protein [Vibrio agarilyticus]